MVRILPGSLRLSLLVVCAEIFSALLTIGYAESFLYILRVMHSDHRGTGFVRKLLNYICTGFAHLKEKKCSGVFYLNLI